MQFMLIFNETQDDFSKRGTPEYLGVWMAYVGSMQQAGVMQSGAGLEPPTTGTTIRIRDGKRQIVDGPYAETKEMLGGYCIIEVPNLDAALEWAARSPTATSGSTEVRPVMPTQNMD